VGFDSIDFVVLFRKGGDSIVVDITANVDQLDSLFQMTISSVLILGTELASKHGNTVFRIYISISEEFSDAIHKTITESLVTLTEILKCRSNQW
jgi:hypothetical protein